MSGNQSKSDTNPDIRKKSADRLDRKKKKIKAFLEIASQNDADLPKRQHLEKYLDSKNKKTASTHIELTAVAKNPADRGKSVQHSNSEDTSKRKKNFEPMDLEELAELRARLRARQKIMMQKAKIYLSLDWVALPCDVCPQEDLKTHRDTSTSSDAESPLSDHQPLFAVDLQHLLLYAMQGEITSYKPRWSKLLRQNKLKHVLVMEFTDISKEHFLAQQSSLLNIKDSDFSLCVELISPAQYNSTFLEEIIHIPISRWQLKKQMRLSTEADIQPADAIKFYQTMPCSGREPDEFSCVSLLLNSEQMVLENYPIPVEMDKYPDWVFSQDEYSEVSPTSPIFAVDCEMCMTSKHISELTRVAVINERLETVYETLVKPYNTVTDYLTRYSGITKQMLSNVTTRLENVQQRLQEILPPDAILCGQSMNSDLKALKMFHPYVIDTSVIYNLSGLRHLKPSLKRLAQDILGESIQNHGKKGHNPIEDALATIKLVQMKLKYGPAFGDVIMGGALTAEDDENPELPESSADVVDSPQQNSSEKQESETTTGTGSNSICDDSLNDCEAPKKKIKLDESGDKEISDDSKQTLTKRLVFFRKQGTNTNRSLFEVAKDSRKKVAVVAPESSLSSLRELNEADSAQLRPVDNCKDCRQASIKAVNSGSFFTWAQFPMQCSEETDIQKKLSRVDRQVKKTLDKCPENVLVVLLLSGEARTTSLANSICLIKVS